MENELVYPTAFTLAQLERIQELVQAANMQRPNAADYNLGRKVQDYLSAARGAVGIGHFRRAS